MSTFATARRLAIIAGLALAIAACADPSPTGHPSAAAVATPTTGVTAPTSSSIAPTPFPSSTPAPTPTATPQSTTSQLVAACRQGAAIAGAARRSGSVHPAVIVGRDDRGDWTVSGQADWDPAFRSSFWTLNDRWFGDSWGGPVQLVVCHQAAPVTRYGSCGPYQHYGRLPREQTAEKAWVVDAATGRTIATRVFKGGRPGPCSTGGTLVVSGGPSHWVLSGDGYDRDALNAWAAKLAGVPPG